MANSKEAAECAQCGHIHERAEVCDVSMDDSLIGLVRHWCECCAPQEQPSVEEARTAMYEFIQNRPGADDAVDAYGLAIRRSILAEVRGLLAKVVINGGQITSRHGDEVFVTRESWETFKSALAAIEQEG